MGSVCGVAIILLLLLFLLRRKKQQQIQKGGGGNDSKDRLSFQDQGEPLALGADQGESLALGADQGGPLALGADQGGGSLQAEGLAALLFLEGAVGKAVRDLGLWPDLDGEDTVLYSFRATPLDSRN